MKVGDLVLLRNKTYGIVLDIDIAPGVKWALIYWNAARRMTWEDIECSAQILKVISESR